MGINGAGMSRGESGSDFDHANQAGKPLGEPVFFWEALAEVLAEALRKRNARGAPGAFGHLALHFERVLDVLLCPPECALAFVAGEHLGLSRERSRDVHEDARGNVRAQYVAPPERGGVIKVRDGSERLRRPWRAGPEVWRHRAETCGLGEAACRLMVHHVVHGRMGHDQIGLGATHQFHDLPQTRKFIEHRKVFFFETGVGGADKAGGAPGFRLSAAGDFRGRKGSAAAIPSGHGGDVNLRTARGKKCESPGRKEFGVVRVREEGEDPHRVHSAGLNAASRRDVPQAISITPPPSLPATVMVRSSVESGDSWVCIGTSARRAAGSCWNSRAVLLDTISTQCPGESSRASRMCLPLGTRVPPKSRSWSEAMRVWKSAPRRQIWPGVICFSMSRPLSDGRP